MNWFDDLKMDPSLSVLPVQSMANAQPVAPSIDPEKEPELIPSDKLKEFLLGKFDEDRIPSGQSTPQQQSMSDLHQDIGNATGNAVASLQNAANIFRPGAGNPAMAQQSRDYGNMLAQRALGDNQAKRQEAIQNMQLGDISDQRKLNHYKMAQSLMQQQEMKNPASSSSKAAQEREASRLDTLMTGTTDPAKIQLINNRKKMLPSMSAETIQLNAANDPLGKLLETESKEYTERSKNEREQSHNQSMENIAAGNLGVAQRGESEKARHNLAEEGLAGNRTEQKKNEQQLKIIGQQPKTVEDIGKLANALENYEQVLNLMDKKDISTGIGPEILQKIKGVTPFMSQDPEWVDLWQKLEANKQNVRLGMEKTVRNNPYMSQQLEALFPEQEQNTGTVKTKIKSLLAPDSVLRNTLRSKVAELRRDPHTGEMIDKSAIAELLAPRVNMDSSTLMKHIDGNQKSSLGQDKINKVKELAAKGNKAAQKMLQDVEAQ